MNMPSPSIETFVDRLREEKGLEGLDDEVLTEVRVDLLSRVEDRINAAILTHMPEEVMPAFDALLDSGDESEIKKFCANHITDFDDVIAAELLAFRETYLGG